MKITSSNTPPAGRAPESNKATNKRGVAQTNDAVADDATGAQTEVQERDFASVLAEVSRGDEHRDSETDSSDRRDLQRPDKAEREGVERREERRGGDAEGRGGGFQHAPGGVREIVSPSEAASARAILHIADLERIVSAVRTQLLTGGQHEVTIELRRSVLEGLQVKLRAGADGRVTAEFIAASERVRAQIDARSGELAEILRSRGINLAALNTTTTSADASGQNQAGHDRSRFDEGVAAFARPQSTDHAPALDRTRREADDVENTGTTYRA